MPGIRARAFITVVLALLSFSVLKAFAEPTLPTAYVDTTYVPPTGRTIAVLAGGDFQAALDAAQPGDVITLEAGAVFRGTFYLRVKEGADWITIRTSAPDSSLPPPGVRITPSYQAVMATLEAGETAEAIIAEPGAHHYRLIGLHIRPPAGEFRYTLIRFGWDENTLSDFPHHLVIDRCYVHGDPAAGGRRGLALNSVQAAVIDSYFADFKEDGADSQAILTYNTPGPLKIVNNYLEAAGENFMSGGAWASRPEFIPADIEIRRNHFSKPLAWRSLEPPWTVKNLLELKTGRRVLIEGNLLEHSWVHAQSGFAVLFTVRNDVLAPRAGIIEDVTFVNNIVRHAAGGIVILGSDDLTPSLTGKRFLIRNNLFEDVGTPAWGDTGMVFALSSFVEDVTIEHNTVLAPDFAAVAAGFGPMPGFVFRDNLVGHGSQVSGQAMLMEYFPDAIMQRNLFFGTVAVQEASSYPPDNFFTASVDTVGFVSLTGDNYRLAAGSPYRHAGTDGKDLGADIDALEAALAGSAAAPAPLPAPAPPPPAPIPPSPAPTPQPPSPTVTSVTITSPPSGQTLTHNQTVVRVKATNPGGLRRMDVYCNSVRMGSINCTKTSCAGAVRWPTDRLLTGPHSIRALATDADGEETWSEPITVHR